MADNINSDVPDVLLDLIKSYCDWVSLCDTMIDANDAGAYAAATTAPGTGNRLAWNLALDSSSFTISDEGDGRKIVTEEITLATNDTGDGVCLAFLASGMTAVICVVPCDISVVDPVSKDIGRVTMIMPQPV